MKGGKSLNLQDSQVARTLENGLKWCMGISSSILNKKHSTPLPNICIFLQVMHQHGHVTGVVFHGFSSQGRDVSLPLRDFMKNDIVHRFKGICLISQVG